MDLVHQTTDWFYRSRRKLATAGVALLACLLAVHVVAGPNGLFTYQQKRAEYRKLEKEVQQLQVENERMATRIESLKSDPNAIEKEAREQLRYARPGEVVYTLPNQPQKSSSPAAAEKKQ
ncbi:MAG TPA: septum formation initiator family protein [Terriglobales bacterium]|nr:septum formation initiator family protein [Terriglobales bacterium]